MIEGVDMYKLLISSLILVSCSSQIQIEPKLDTQVAVDTLPEVLFSNDNVVNDIRDVQPLDLHDSTMDIAVELVDSLVDDVELDVKLDHKAEDNIVFDIFEVGPDSIEDVEDVEDVPVPDDTESCEQECSGKVCGPDGCLGVCGYCAWGQVCTVLGTCESDGCSSNCLTDDGEVVECGSDDCGGYCGFCLGTAHCGADSFCYEDGCEGSCDGKSCGINECGEVCGYCQAYQLCNEAGQCVEHPCGEVSSMGQCLDQHTVLRCDNLEVVEINCLTLEDKECGWDTDLNAYSCIEPEFCVPSCETEDGSNRECGPDGCWGYCGYCPIGWGCTSGSCKPGQMAECSWIEESHCFDHELWFCSADKLYQYDCFVKEGKTCGWDPDAGLGQGGYACVDFIAY